MPLQRFTPRTGLAPVDSHCCSPSDATSLKFTPVSTCPQLPDGGPKLRRVDGLSLHSAAPLSGVIPERPLETSRDGFYTYARVLVLHGERLLRRHMPVRAVCVGSPNHFRSFDFADSSHGVHQKVPSIDITIGVHSRTNRRSSFGALRAKPRTRSVLVVPPDSDGLLHPWFRKSVAPCSRSWGSPCFNLCWRWCPRPTARRLQSSPLRRVPFEAFPSPVAVFMSP